MSKKSEAPMLVYIPKKYVSAQFIQSVELVEVTKTRVVINYVDLYGDLRQMRLETE